MCNFLKEVYVWLTLVNITKKEKVRNITKDTSDADMTIQSEELIKCLAGIAVIKKKNCE
ncbi:MAG: hypothetical protein IJT84_05220 [Clostridia bacterium]|nr:hypothetical protein [Clostridia bacterium]